jgi:alpha-1,2-mannosyltransferase
VFATATAGLATLLAHAAAPQDSTHYWTKTLLGGEGVGHLWFFTNQSISGVLARVYEPNPYPTWLWVVLSVPVAIYGLWRARRAALAGDELTGMALAGFVASLVSPVTWVHHIFWWVPALLAIADTALTPLDPRPSGTAAQRAARVLRDGLRHPVGLAFVALLTYPIVAVSAAADPGTGWVSVVLVNWLVWLMLLLLVTLPIDPDRGTADREAIDRAARDRAQARDRPAVVT